MAVIPYGWLMMPLYNCFNELPTVVIVGAESLLGLAG